MTAYSGGPTLSQILSPDPRDRQHDMPAVVPVPMRRVIGKAHKPPCHRLNSPARPDQERHVAGPADNPAQRKPLSGREAALIFKPSLCDQKRVVTVGVRRYDAIAPSSGRFAH